MLLGLLLLAVSLWIRLDENMIRPLAAEMGSYSHVVYFLMVVAGVMTVMGFLGCCGALQENQCMLATFFSLVLVLFLGQVATGVWIHQNQDRFKQIVEKSAAQSIQHDYGYNEFKTEAFDKIQTQLRCCGASGHQDWAESRYNNADRKSALEVGVGTITRAYKVPKSCCKDPGSVMCETSRQVTLIAGLTDAIYETGCAEKMVKLVEKYDYVALAVILAVLLSELMAMVFSMVLCCAVRRIDNFKA